jgi:hypothetical protein
MNESICVATGFVYRGEAIHTLASGQVVIYPSWLGGARAEFEKPSEARAFVDARLVAVMA